MSQQGPALVTARPMQPLSRTENVSFGQAVPGGPCGPSPRPCKVLSVSVSHTGKLRQSLLADILG